MNKIKLLKDWIAEWKAGDELIVGEHVVETIADRLVRDGDAVRVNADGKVRPKATKTKAPAAVKG